MSVADLSVLSKRLNAVQRDLDVLDSYYDGTQAISFLHPEVRELVGNRLTTLIINWPAHVLDSLENRLDVEGFRVGKADDTDDDLWKIWQDNNLDVDSQIAHLEMLLYGRSAVSVWPENNRSQTPIISVESAKQVMFDFEPGTRKVRSVLKQWSDEKVIHASLFYPDRVEVYAGRSRSSVANSDGSKTITAPYEIGSVVKLVDEVPNPLGVVPFIPLVNKRRTSLLDGQSELAAIIPLADAVNKLATDMMVTSEFYAAPRRYATGIELPPPGGGEGADARRRLQTEARAYWDSATKGKTWLAGKDVQFGQFQEAQLSSFVSAIEMLTNFLGALGVLPPHYMGISTKNPASADAIRSAEASLTKRAQRKQRPTGGTWETALSYATAIRQGVPVAKLDPKYRSMETVWADPETRTIAQLGDFAQKMVDADIVAVPTAQEMIGMTPQQRQRDDDYRKRADPLQVLQTRLAFARQLMTQESLTRESAFALAGLVGPDAAVAARLLESAPTAPQAAPPNAPAS